jgi:MFS family permease
MFIAITILLAGSIAEITVSNWQGWLGGAMLIRLGVGLAQSVLVTYLSELAPFQIRGLLIGSYQLMLAFGQLIVAVAAQLITIHQPTKYKPLIALEFLFTGVGIMFLRWSPSC